MKTSDRYHKWVEWSEANQAYLGKCPDLITGIHGDDPQEVYADLCEVIEDVITHFESENRPLPAPNVKPMQEVA
jgi:predicted RNase H-like HicB family nuclease